MDTTKVRKGLWMDFVGGSGVGESKRKMDTVILLGMLYADSIGLHTISIADILEQDLNNGQSNSKESKTSNRSRGEKGVRVLKGQAYQGEPFGGGLGGGQGTQYTLGPHLGANKILSCMFLIGLY